MADPKQDRIETELGARKTVSLTERDIEDAKRLFAILAGAQSEGQSLPRALYERLQSETGKLQQRARQILELRGRRARIFGNAMFGEPAWDILLVLYATGGGITMNRLAQLSGQSQATGLRWMNYLADQKLVDRVAHPTDARSLNVVLTERGRTSLEAFLSDMDDLES